MRHGLILSIGLLFLPAPGLLPPPLLLAGEVDDAISSANALLRQGKGTEARDLLEPLAKENPSSAPLQYVLAQAAILERDFTRARKHLEKTVELDAANLDARMVLSSIYRKEKKPRDATKQLQEVLKRDPKNSGAMRGMGELEQDAGRGDRAAEWYEKALSQKPDDLKLASLVASAWTDSVKALAEGPKKKRDENCDKAMAAYQRVLKLKPDFDEVHYNMGTVAMLCERYGDAIRSLKAFLEKRPGDPRGLFNLAQALEKNGNAKEALETWRLFLDAAEKGDKSVKGDIPQAKEHIKVLEKEAKKEAKKSKKK